MTDQDKGLKILKATIKNFKSYDLKEIDFNGRSIFIAGPNMAGKSSLIQAICSPLNAKYTPLNPIKEGEEKGEIELEIGGELGGEQMKYFISFYFSQGNKKGRLVLKQEDGTLIKGGERGILDSIIGDISFDIMEFVRMAFTDTGKLSESGVRKQVEVLKQLMPQEDVETLFNLDKEYKEVYDNRTETNRDKDKIKLKVDNPGFTQEEIEKYSKPTTAGGLSDQLKKAEKYNEAIDNSNIFLEKYDRRNEDIDTEIERLEKLLQVEKDKKTELQKQKAKVDEFMSKNPEKKDTEAIEKSIDSISEHNTNHQKVLQIEEDKKSLQKFIEQAEAQTLRLEEIKKEKKKVFQNSTMPVKGLEFDDSCVTFNGVPLTSNDLSSSELIGIGLRIGMALNTNLRLLVIRDGSLIDEDIMKGILKMCHKKGYQLLIEKVEKTDDKEVKIEFIEN